MRRETYLSRLALKTPEILREQKVDQCGAICWRLDEAGKIEILLITSRDTGRWVIPKGNIEKNEQLHKCARREALEEAGVVGRVSKKAIGYYTYLKDPVKPPFLVSVFSFQIESEVSDFKECGVRRSTWVSPSEAAALVDEPELKGIFRLIAGNSKPKAFAKVAEKVLIHRSH
jgi:8-oxo-dGTP pyrophosphatase MutT (NUDIX family)